MKALHAFGWGCLGGAAPHAVMLYKVVTGMTSQPLPTFSAVYISVMVVFTVFAGLFALGWKPEHPLKAIWVGVSFPTIISAMLHVPP